MEQIPLLPQPQPLRKLLPRHLQMIAIGGTIGTGLFIGGGTSIATSGPLGALSAYLIVSIMVYAVVTSIGELACFNPKSGSFNSYASAYFDESLSFALGWNYWLQWAVSLPSELSAAGLIMTYWIPGTASWVWAALILTILTVIHFYGVKGFGETEYWLSFIKCAAIVLFIFAGLAIDFGWIGSGGSIGMDLWWIHDAPFKNGAAGFFQTFLVAFFAFGGTELIGITAGEVVNPQAIKQTFWRILMFYIGSIFVMGLVIRHDDPSLLTSSSRDISIAPFTLIFKRAGLSFAANLMNGVVFSAVISAGNSAIYAASRTLMALSREGKAPLLFSNLNSSGVPTYSILASLFIGCLSFLGIFWGDGFVFTWLLHLTGVSGLITWMSISIIHIRFRNALKYQGVDLNDLVYLAPMYPLGPYVTLFLGMGILIGQTVIFASQPQFLWADLINMYFGLFTFFVLVVGYKVWHKTSLVPLGEIDLMQYVESCGEETEA